MEIIEWKTNETVEVLEELLKLAKDGEITGLMFSYKLLGHRGGIGLTGEYRKDPISVLQPAARLSHILNRMFDRT